jgi:hypothetical protein
MAQHLDDVLARDLITGRLTADVSRTLEDHVGTCAACQDLLMEVSKVAASGTHTIEDPTDPGRRPGELPQPGNVLSDRFRIRSRLGEGGMGVVYLADDLELGVPVALKLLPQRLRESPSFVKRLLRELLVGRRIAHPNVCRLYDLGMHEELRFLTMEYVEGHTLQHVIERGGPPADQVHDILLQIGRALAAAHAEHVAHRDLKPANVMIDGNGRVKVMDFGLARDLTSDSSHLVVAGTPMYWAPEQARGEAAGPPADVFAFGMLMTTLVAGGAHPRLPESRELVPQVYQPVLKRCLAADPAARYPDGQALLTALVAVDQILRLAPSPARAQPRTRTVPVLLIAAGALTVLGLGAWWLRDRPTASEPTAVRVIAPAAVVDAAPPAVATRLEATPDGGPGLVAPPPAAAADAGPRRGTARRPPPTSVPAPAPAATPAVPDAGPPPVAAPAVDPEPAAELVTARQRLGAIEAERKRRGLMIDDLPGYATLADAARAALATGDHATADGHLGGMDTAVRGAVIDGAFIDGKVRRLQKVFAAPLASPAAEAERKQALEAVHAAFRAGRWAEANRLLNAAAALR